MVGSLSAAIFGLAIEGKERFPSTGAAPNFEGRIAPAL